jgi:hypothetical protein
VVFPVVSLSQQTNFKNKTFKKMKAQTLQQRLEKRYTGSKTAKSYQIIKDLITGQNYTYSVKGNIIRPCRTSGMGRFTTNLDYTNDVEALLKLLGIRYETGNDSPKGGKPGNFIKVLTKIQY